MIQNSRTIDPQTAGFLIAAVSVIAPIVFMFHPLVDGYPPHFTIYASIFTFDYVHGYITFAFSTMFAAFGFLLFSVPRFIFSYQVHRYYSGISNLRMTKYMGVFAEICIIAIAGIMDLSTLISLIFGGWMTSLMIPLPIPLIAYLILNRWRSPEPKELWLEEAEKSEEIEPSVEEEWL
ncbi:MAG: hypothetical protein ACW98Y_09315 [Candidatus Thorarchaeota archaeon]|jgi:hypothetical protein